VTGRVAGKRALVTGAARGIGRACAIRFAQEGADVALLDIGASISTAPYEGPTPTQMDETGEAVTALGRKTLAYTADVTNQESLDIAVRAILSAWGGIDIVVAAAGIDSWGNAWELSEAAWQQMLDIDLGGVWRTAKAVAPAMIAQKSGAMVFIGSVLSHRANRQFAHYTAAKHGVLGLTRSFALELAPFMIRVNSVDPTVVRTDMVTNQAYLDRLGGHPGTTEEESRRYYLGWNTLPVPWLEPVDVANAVLFLASDEARYITGVALPVDLGALLK
jgi:(+)-trans-carveol dehydrogenase